MANIFISPSPFCTSLKNPWSKLYVSYGQGKFWLQIKDLGTVLYVGISIWHLFFFTSMFLSSFLYHALELWLRWFDFYPNRVHCMGEACWKCAQMHRKCNFKKETNYTLLEKSLLNQNNIINQEERSFWRSNPIGCIRCYICNVIYPSQNSFILNMIS